MTLITLWVRAKNTFYNTEYKFYIYRERTLHVSLTPLWRVQDYFFCQ